MLRAEVMSEASSRLKRALDKKEQPDTAVVVVPSRPLYEKSRRELIHQIVQALRVEFIFQKIDEGMMRFVDR